MPKPSYICNCDVIHEDIVNDVKSKMQPKDDYIPVSYTHLMGHANAGQFFIRKASRCSARR